MVARGVALALLGLLLLGSLLTLWNYRSVKRWLRPAQQRSKPTALLHIGPHKTGTTYFQSFVVKNEEKLAAYNYFIWPNMSDQIKYCVQQCKFGRWHYHPICQKRARTKFRSGRTKQLSEFFHMWSTCKRFREHIIKFFKRSRKQSKGVIFSSEEWSDAIFFYPSEVESFLSVISVFYKVHVVINYRNPVNRYISKYNEVFKMSMMTGSNKSMELFSEFYSKVNVVGECNYYGAVIEKYLTIINKFNQTNLTVIDYYGVTAVENLDLNFVLLCEILGIFCDEFSTTAKYNSSEKNPSISEIPLQVASLFLEYSRRYQCNCPRKSSFMKDLYYHQWGNTPAPVRLIDMTDFADQSLHADDELRKQFAHLILYGNRSSNVKNVKRSHAEVDNVAIADSTLWQKQFSKKLLKLNRTGWCNISQQLSIT